MNKETWRMLWRRFIHWPGWTAWLKWSGWKAMAAWQGWKKMFVIPLAIVIPLTLLSAAGLVWIFLTGREESFIAYLTYVLSFYALVTLSIRIPGCVRKGKALLNRNALAQRYLTDEEWRFRLELYFEQCVNFLYGGFKCVTGVIFRSAWIGAEGLYNLVQGIIQLVQILRRRKQLTLLRQWKSYRLCGWLVLVMHLTMTGLVFQMIHRGAFEEYPGYMILLTAMFAFYKLISAFVDVAKDRKHKAPIDSAVRLLDLSQAMFSLFSLQVAMIHQFEGTEEFAKLMNTLTGGAVCLLVVGMGIYMLRRSRREMRKLEETKNG